MNKFLCLLLLCSFSLSVMGKEGATGSAAKKLNKQTEDFLLKLEQTQKSDSALYYEYTQQAIRSALMCDYYDERANKANLRYRLKNRKRLSSYLNTLLEAGMYRYNLRQNQVAMELFRLYINCSESALFQGQVFSRGLVAYYISLLAYGTKDYRLSERFADIALQDDNYAKDAAEIKVNCMKMHLANRTDSTKYLLALLALYEKAPDNDAYFRLLMEYFSALGHEQEMAQFADDEIRRHPNNKLVWALKGETEMKAKKWDDALLAFGRVVQEDSTMVEALYNIGVCYCSKAIELKKSLTNTRGKIKVKDLQRVKDMLAHALEWFKRTALEDPDEKIIKWKEPLEQVKNVLAN